MNILIVEDDTLLAERIEQHLLMKGYKVAGTADSYEEVRAILSKQTIDLALVDIKLSGPENGIIIASELLKTKWIPLIYMTGETSDAIVEKCKATFPVGYLVKPLDMRELIIQVELADQNISQGNMIPYQESRSENIYLASAKGYVRINKKEILYIQADRSNAKIFLTGDGRKRILQGSQITYIQAGMNMGRILAQLPANFYRLSRSLVINLDYVDLVGSDHIDIEQHSISIPEGGRPDLINRLGVIKTR